LREGIGFKEVIDLSVPLKSLDTPVFPGHPQPLRSTFTTIEDQGYLSYVWMFVEHASTHLDAPVHFYSGAPSVDEISLSKCVGQGVVLDFSNKPPNHSISREDLMGALRGKVTGDGAILLFYTGYTAKSRTPQWMDHLELSEEACSFVVEKRFNAVGFDAPSADHPPFPAHKFLLPKSVYIYENLSNLDKLIGKEFLFVGAPLALSGGSGSPVRAFALVYQ
jgi:arylformamidase